MDSQVKLNLGCGDKILEGYTNVDVASDGLEYYLISFAILEILTNSLITLPMKFWLYT